MCQLFLTKSHKCFHKGSKATGCTKYVTLPDDYRLSIQRDSIPFKSVYALRTECERYNSRFKATAQERLWVRNKKSAENLNSIAHISLLAIAMAAFVTRHPNLSRSRKLCSRCAWLLSYLYFQSGTAYLRAVSFCPVLNSSLYYYCSIQS